MIATCRRCRQTFETTTEDAYEPAWSGGGPVCAVCFWRDKCQVLEAVNAELLVACEEVMEFLSNGTPVYPGALVQASVFNAIQLAKGGGR